MNWVDYIAGVLQRLEQHYHLMAGAFEPPVFVSRDGAPFFRHREQSDTLLCFLKGVKLISTLNASLLLYRIGFAQELSALARIADDLFNDILFMLKPLGADTPSKDQDRFFEEFFQEEFANPQDPLGSAQKRDIVPRRKLHATFGQLAKDELNASDAQATMSAIHAAFSGYVHGAYPHIMEMYGGNPGRFHRSGRQATPRMAELSGQLITYVHRGIMVSELVARKLGLKDSEMELRTLLIAYETALDCKPDSDAETQLRRLKSKAESNS